ncbi:DUF4160 domain-containing protein [Azotobacter chroococcum]|uniref:DUF4160 domain-containing protein n=1 Tax=Azotobacter chroococcum TaxID=353 RepID=UPI0009E452C3|nr:DUF4160 domain-containing protein [Azotobacter chroococcum]TBW03900.1 DUF4160 domain-containing protein [Azotobacter chroococcum]
MPTVLRFNGLRAVIYPNDHRPAHVHVMGHGCEAVFNLHCPAGPPELRENFGFSLKELNSIESMLAAELPTACAEWEVIHGQP